MYRILLILCLFSILWMYRTSDLQQNKQIHNPANNSNTSEDKFIRDLIITPSQKFGKTKPFIFIIVTSHVKHIEMRNVIRIAMPREYLQLKNTIRLFLLGTIPPNEQFITQNAIENENKTFGDILQGSFLEIYRNLPFKILMGLQWAAHTCNDASYILKVDDDTIFNLERTYALLTSTKIKGDFLMGYMFNNSKPQRDNENKWYVTWEEYPRNDYPPYLSGWYYITTPNTALRLTNEAAYHPYFWIEDILITGLLTEALNIRLVQLPEGYVMVFSKRHHYVGSSLRDMSSLASKYEKYYFNTLAQKVDFT